MPNLNQVCGCRKTIHKVRMADLKTTLGGAKTDTFLNDILKL